MNQSFSDSSRNLSAQTAEEMDPQWIGILEALILFSIMLLAIFGNSLVIAVVYRRRELRRTETHIFIVNLSITDISVALLCMPFSLLTAITQDWIFSADLCQVNGFLNVFFLLTSILTLTAISIHKYVGVVQPTKRKIFTRKRTIFAVLWVWCQALVTALTPILGWNSYEYIPGRTQCSVKVPRDNKASELANCLFIIVCGFVIPLGIMSFSYLKIFQTVKIHMQRVRSHSFGEEQSAFLNERRIIVTLFIILAVFLACWTPFSVLTIYATVAGEELPKYFSVAAYWLGFLNSAMNPVIYALRTKEFRQGYRQIFGIILPCCFSRVNSRDSESAAVLHGRRSLKSDVQMTLKRRCNTENGISARTECRSTLNGIETSTERQRKESGSFDAVDEFYSKQKQTLCSESIGKCNYSSVNEAMAADEDHSGVEVHKNGEIFHYEKTSEGATFGDKEGSAFPNDSDFSNGYLSAPISEILPADLQRFSSEEAFSKNLGEDFARSRRKSTSFLTSFHKELERKVRLHRSKSDCSCASQHFERERVSLSPINCITKQTTDPRPQEHYSNLNSIETIEIADKIETAD